MQNLVFNLNASAARTTATFFVSRRSNSTRGEQNVYCLRNGERAKKKKKNGERLALCIHAIFNQEAIARCAY